MALSLFPFTRQDRARVEAALQATQDLRESPLALLSWAPHHIWSHFFSYSWVTLEGWLCVFAEYPDGLYMPLPPLTLLDQERSISQAVCSYDRVLQVVFEQMTSRNGEGEVTRIENIPEEWKAEFESLGYLLREKDPDYLYDTKDLVELKGARYKSQRAACNQFLRSSSSSYGVYRNTDLEECLALFDKWAKQKRAATSEKCGEQDTWLRDTMLDQARQAHCATMRDVDELGLIGRVLRVNGTICGYTFGYERNAQVWCILLEVADRTIPGAAQYLFREFCREQGHYTFINTMDDSGLTGLGQSKSAYHPCRMVKNFIATMA